MTKQTATPSATSAWRDPWPSAQPAWQDPPWVLSGRVVTGWFEASWSAIEASVSPDLLPESRPTLRTRLRFYDLRFEAESPDSRQLAPATGAFRECSLGFAARARDVEGEISAYLWSDSSIYTMWAREAFGWPVVPAEFALDGSIWGEDPGASSTGSARMTDAHGMAELAGIMLANEPASLGSPGAPWLTPRRTMRWDGSDRDEREVLLVRPQTRVAGRCYRGSGQVRFRFPPDHALGNIEGAEAEVELIDGVVLAVGADVKVLR